MITSLVLQANQGLVIYGFQGHSNHKIVVTFWWENDELRFREEMFKRLSYFCYNLQYYLFDLNLIWFLKAPVFYVYLSFNKLFVTYYYMDYYFFCTETICIGQLCSKFVDFTILSVYHFLWTI